MRRIMREKFIHHIILIIADRLDTVRYADIVLVTEKGKVVEVGSPDELLAKKVEMKAASGSQVREEVEEEDWEKVRFKEL